MGGEEQIRTSLCLWRRIRRFSTIWWDTHRSQSAKLIFIKGKPGNLSIITQSPVSRLSRKDKSPVLKLVPPSCLSGDSLSCSLKMARIIQGSNGNVKFRFHFQRQPSWNLCSRSSRPVVMPTIISTPFVLMWTGANKNNSRVNLKNNFILNKYNPVLPATINANSSNSQITNPIQLLPLPVRLQRLYILALNTDNTEFKSLYTLDYHLQSRSTGIRWNLFVNLTIFLWLELNRPILQRCLIIRRRQFP